ncbi:MAG TPA: aminodeoxychorismate/anthranilate synthase component II [Cryomorphaceae bacterium]|nr:aminodeoxychorismate/anthranilate synthase component II [Cryomorphaceae bacterium]
MTTPHAFPTATLRALEPLGLPHPSRGYLCAMHVAILDNLDSFTFNLAHRLEPMVDRVTVVRNDDAHAMDILESGDVLIFSPGPGLPPDAGCLMEAVQRFVGRKPILGVCLGMQALGLHAGGTLYHAGPPQHGVARTIDQALVHSHLFANMSFPMEVGLYHSWAVEGIDEAVTARLSHGVAMAAEWPEIGAYAVQFHPESILTPAGDALLANWVARAREDAARLAGRA